MLFNKYIDETVIFPVVFFCVAVVYSCAITIIIIKKAAAQRALLASVEAVEEVRIMMKVSWMGAQSFAYRQSFYFRFYCWNTPWLCVSQGQILHLQRIPRPVLDSTDPRVDPVMHLHKSYKFFVSCPESRNNP